MIVQMDFSTFKKKVKKNQGMRCNCCGYKHRNNHVHHIIPTRLNKELKYDERNCVVLCHKCHSEYHRTFRINQCNLETLMCFMGSNNKFVKERKRLIQLEELRKENKNRIIVRKKKS